MNERLASVERMNEVYEVKDRYTTAGMYSINSKLVWGDRRCR